MMHVSLNRWLVPSVAVVACTWSCADPLVAPQTLVGPRIIAAKVSATDAPERAQLHSGEQAHLQWLVASNERTEYTATAVWCVAKETNIGLQECAQAPFAEQVVTGSTDEPAGFDFEVPDADGAQKWLAWLGVCEDSAPEFDWKRRSFDCTDGAMPLQGVYEGLFASATTDGPFNNNPDLSDDSLIIDDDDWTSSDLEVGTACADVDVPQIHPGSSRRLRWDADSEDRQTLEPSDVYAAAERESLVFTHIASAAGLSRPFSVVAANSEQQNFELDFTLADDFETRATGVAISFFLVVRDERGGTDWERKVLCAVPD